MSFPGLVMCKVAGVLWTEETRKSSHIKAIFKPVVACLVHQRELHKKKIYLHRREHHMFRWATCKFNILFTGDFIEEEKDQTRLGDVTRGTVH